MATSGLKFRSLKDINTIEFIDYLASCQDEDSKDILCVPGICIALHCSMDLFYQYAGRMQPNASEAVLAYFERLSNICAYQIEQVSYKMRDGDPKSLALFLKQHHNYKDKSEVSVSGSYALEMINRSEEADVIVNDTAQKFIEKRGLGIDFTAPTGDNKENSK